MEELDLSGVDPLRLAEVRRRVAVVRSFLSIETPDDADRREHGKRLGLSVNQFMALVRAWKEYGSPARLACSGASRGAVRRPSRLAIPTMAKVMAADVIDQLGSRAPFVKIHAAVVVRCAAQCVAPPSRSTLWNMVTRRRQHEPAAGNGVLVGRCRIRLPVEIDGRIGLPEIVLAITGVNGAVLAAGMTTGPVSWPALIASLQGAETRIRIDETLLQQQDAAHPQVEELGTTVASSELSRALGRGIDSLRLVYRSSRSVAPECLLTAKEDRPLSWADARDIAVARHNAARGAVDAIWVTPKGGSGSEASK